MSMFILPGLLTVEVRRRFRGNVLYCYYNVGFLSYRLHLIVVKWAYAPRWTVQHLLFTHRLLICYHSCCFTWLPFSFFFCFNVVPRFFSISFGNSWFFRVLHGLLCPHGEELVAGVKVFIDTWDSVVIMLYDRPQTICPRGNSFNPKDDSKIKDTTVVFL